MFASNSLSFLTYVRICVSMHVCVCVCVCVQDHTRKMAELDQTLATLVETSNQQMAAVNSKRDTLTEEQKSLENTYKFTKSKVKLDIGGTRFTTSRSTLNSCKESLLAAMFSGRYVLQPDEQEASFFIDRDGRYFHHVLNYLRSPREFEPPADLLSLNKILNDASFFRVGALAVHVTSSCFPLAIGLGGKNALCGDASQQLGQEFCSQLPARVHLLLRKKLIYCSQLLARVAVLTILHAWCLLQIQPLVDVMTAAIQVTINRLIVECHVFHAALLPCTACGCLLDVRLAASLPTFARPSCDSAPCVSSLLGATGQRHLPVGFAAMGTLSYSPAHWKAAARRRRTGPSNICIAKLCLPHATTVSNVPYTPAGTTALEEWRASHTGDWSAGHACADVLTSAASHLWLCTGIARAQRRCNVAWHRRCTRQSNGQSNSLNANSVRATAGHFRMEERNRLCVCLKRKQNSLYLLLLKNKQLPLAELSHSVGASRRIEHT